MLSVQHLSKHYGDTLAVDDLSFTLNRGEIVALLGANGSGKTTTINAICKLVEHDQGSISFDGKPIENDRHYLQNVGAVLGGCRNVNWRLTPRQNADYFARLRGSRSRDFRPFIDTLVSLLGLEENQHKPVMKLSTGNKQKTALLSALASKPSLLLLDEPTLGLDLETVHALQAAIEHFAKSGEHGFLITSHDLNFIDRVCNRVIVIDKGRQVFSGEISALKQRLYRYELAMSLSDTDRGIVASTLPTLWHDDHKILHRDDAICVQYNAPQDAFSTISWLEQQGIVPDNLNISELSMENAYRSLLVKEEASL